jgi:hypothetical protein
VNFVKKSLPLFFGMAVGFYALAEFYIAHYKVKDFTTDLLNWAQILSAAAYVLGAVNILQFNVPKIRRRERDWPYKLVLLIAAAVMFAVGILKVVIDPEADGSVQIAQAADPTAAGAGRAVVVFDVPDDVMVSAAGSAPRTSRDADGKPVRFDVPPGPVAFRVFRRIAGYRDYSEADWVKAPAAEHARKIAALEAELAKADCANREAKTAELDQLRGGVPVAPVLAAGDVMTVRGDPPMTWGKEGRAYNWFYDHVFAPCNSTMFALLAFFVVSAAFRAFRARNMEAGLLLGGAILVMLGRVPIGRAISENLPSIAQWILDVPNNGSRRAIMMGAAIGAIATGLRILLGLERSHLGSDE